MTPEPPTDRPVESKFGEPLLKLFGEFIDDESIERTKEDLDETATKQILWIATILRCLQESTDEHANDLAADGFDLKSEEAKQRAAEYERAYWSICRIWPTATTEQIFEEDDQLSAQNEALKAEVEKMRKAAE